MVEGLERAIAAKAVTYYLHNLTEGATPLECGEFGKAVVERMTWCSSDLPGGIMLRFDAVTRWGTTDLQPPDGCDLESWYEEMGYASVQSFGDEFGFHFNLWEHPSGGCPTLPGWGTESLTKRDVYGAAIMET